MKKWNTIGLAVLHISASFAPFLSGLIFHSSPLAGIVGGLTSLTLIGALLSRALRVDDDYEMMMSALEVSPKLDDDEITLPQARLPEEPSTGVKMRTVTEVPRVISWHGKRGNG